MGMEVLILCLCMLFSSSYQNALKFNTTQLVQNHSNPKKNENGNSVSKYNFTISEDGKIIIDDRGLDDAINGIKNAFNGITSVLDGIVDQVKSTFNEAYDEVTRPFKNLYG